MKNAVHYPSKNGRKNITKYILNSLIMQLIYIWFFNNAIYRVFINHLIFYFLFTHPGVGEHFVMLKLWKKWECYFREYTAIQWREYIMFTPSHATVCVHYTTIRRSHVKHRWSWELQEIDSILRKLKNIVQFFIFHEFWCPVMILWMGLKMQT